MKYYFAAGFSALLVGIFLASSVFALTISPAKLEITGDPGTTIFEEFELFNEQQDVKTLYASVANFDSNGESGAPHFLTTKDGLASWISTSSSITLNPGERKKVSFSIAIPAGAEPGGHFAAIFWGSQPQGGQSGGEVSIGSKLGILVLLKVSGAVEEGGGLLEFTTENKQKFFAATPISFSYRLNNAGGNRMVPRGEIKVKNLFLWNSATILANEKEGSVLPGSTRKFQVFWGAELEERPGFFDMAWHQLKHFHFGWYSAHLSLVFGENNQAASKSFSFFIIPWHLLSIIIILLLIIGFFGRLAIKKYNRWIISTVQNQSKMNG